MYKPAVPAVLTRLNCRVNSFHNNGKSTGFDLTSGKGLHLKNVGSVCHFPCSRTGVEPLLNPQWQKNTCRCWKVNALEVWYGYRDRVLNEYCFLWHHPILWRVRNSVRIFFLTVINSIHWYYETKWQLLPCKWRQRWVLIRVASCFVKGFLRLKGFIYNSWAVSL